MNTKSQEMLTLDLQEGRSWQVGRSVGLSSPDKWSIPAGISFSRQHFRATLRGGKLIIEAHKNCNPIVFLGEPRENFTVLEGQEFSTADLVFEFDRASNPERFTDKEYDLLRITGMMSILVNRGIGFGRIFELLIRHHRGWLQPVLQDLETTVLQGEPLSRALSRYPEVFPDSYVASIELGERSDLGKVLDRLYHELARDSIKRTPVAWLVPTGLAPACRNLADMLEIGGQESDALAMVARACADQQVKNAFLELASQLEGGIRFSECAFPPAFPPIFAGLLSAHEEVGSALVAFRELADLLGLVEALAS